MDRASGASLRLTVAETTTNMLQNTLDHAGPMASRLKVVESLDASVYRKHVAGLVADMTNLRALCIRHALEWESVSYVSSFIDLAGSFLSLDIKIDILQGFPFGMLKNLRRLSVRVRHGAHATQRGRGVSAVHKGAGRVCSGLLFGQYPRAGCANPTDRFCSVHEVIEERRHLRPALDCVTLPMAPFKREVWSEI
jgi:hypothetical protein